MLSALIWDPVAFVVGCVAFGDPLITHKLDFSKRKCFGKLVQYSTSVQHVRWYTNKLRKVLQMNQNRKHHAWGNFVVVFTEMAYDGEKFPVLREKRNTHSNMFSLLLSTEAESV